MLNQLQTNKNCNCEGWTLALCSSGSGQRSWILETLAAQRLLISAESPADLYELLSLNSCLLKETDPDFCFCWSINTNLKDIFSSVYKNVFPTINISLHYFICSNRGVGLSYLLFVNLRILMRCTYKYNYI